LHYRAAQKLNLSSSPHRRRRSGDENIGSDELPIFPNGYAALLLKSPPPAPPALLRRIGVKELTGVGKKTSRLQLRVAVRSSLSSLAFQRVLPERQRDFRAPGRNPRFPSISVSVSGGTFGPFCPASNLELGLSRRVISTRDATKLQYYTNSGSDISARASYGEKAPGRSGDICGQSMGTTGPRGPRGIRRIIGGHCGFRDSSSPSRTILGGTPKYRARSTVDSHNYPDFCFDLLCSN
ncbi:hypothetical protein EAG_09370, partial [Camponotus floridanus]